MSILAIDPGTHESGWVVLDDDDDLSARWRARVRDSGVSPNADVLNHVRAWGGYLAIEMITSYGMPVGADVFGTVVWIGRFIQAYHWPDHPDRVRLIPRHEVKLYLCASMRAKDPNIRQALIDLLGPPGTKKAPGGTYGVKSHAWAALGVAVTAKGISA